MPEKALADDKGWTWVLDDLCPDGPRFLIAAAEPDSLQERLR